MCIHQSHYIPIKSSLNHHEIGIFGGWNPKFYAVDTQWSLCCQDAGGRFPLQNLTNAVFALLKPQSKCDLRGLRPISMGQFFGPLSISLRLMILATSAFQYSCRFHKLGPWGKTNIIMRWNIGNERDCWGFAVLGTTLSPILPWYWGGAKQSQCCQAHQAFKRLQITATRWHQVVPSSCMLLTLSRFVLSKYVIAISICVWLPEYIYIYIADFWTFFGLRTSSASPGNSFTPVPTRPAVDTQGSRSQQRSWRRNSVIAPVAPVITINISSLTIPMGGWWNCFTHRWKAWNKHAIMSGCRLKHAMFVLQFVSARLSRYRVWTYQEVVHWMAAA